jgi:hypothetical protein
LNERNTTLARVVDEEEVDGMLMVEEEAGDRATTGGEEATMVNASSHSNQNFRKEPADLH